MYAAAIGLENSTPDKLLLQVQCLLFLNLILYKQDHLYMNYMKIEHTRKFRVHPVASII